MIFLTGSTDSPTARVISRPPPPGLLGTVQCQHGAFQFLEIPLSQMNQDSWSPSSSLPGWGLSCSPRQRTGHFWPMSTYLWKRGRALGCPWSPKGPRIPGPVFSGQRVSARPREAQRLGPHSDPQSADPRPDHRQRDRTKGQWR